MKKTAYLSDGSLKGNNKWAPLQVLRNIHSQLLGALAQLCQADPALQGGEVDPSSWKAAALPLSITMDNIPVSNVLVLLRGRRGTGGAAGGVAASSGRALS